MSGTNDFARRQTPTPRNASGRKNCLEASRKHELLRNLAIVAPPLMEGESDMAVTNATHDLFSGLPERFSALDRRQRLGSRLISFFQNVAGLSWSVYQIDMGRMSLSGRTGTPVWWE